MGGYDKRYIFHGWEWLEGKGYGGNDSYSLKSQSKVCVTTSTEIKVLTKVEPVI